MRRPCCFLVAQLLVFALFVVVSTDALGLGDDGGCTILTLLPFTNQKRPNVGGPKPGPAGQDPPGLEDVNRWPGDLLHHYSYSYLAAAQLAMDHFNARNPVVVPQLAEIGNECTVYFPDQFVVDSALKDATSVMGVLRGHHAQLAKHLQQSINSRRSRRTRALVGELAELLIEQCPSLAEFSIDNLLPPWCAVLGPKGDRAVNQVSVLTSALDIPQILYSPTADLAFMPDVPSTVGVGLPSSGRARAIVGYLQRPGWERNFVAILHKPGPGLSDVARSIESIGKEFGLKSVAKEGDITKIGEDKMTAIRNGVQWLKETGMRTIFLALDDPADIQKQAEVLDELNMLSEEYVYLLTEEAVSLDQVGDIFGQVEPRSPLDKLLSGAAVISQIDKFDVFDDDSFLKVWKMQNSSFVDYLNGLVPIDETTSVPAFQAESTYFQDHNPAAMASFMYDSVIAVGLGACQYQVLNQDGSSDIQQQPSGNLSSQEQEQSFAPSENSTLLPGQQGQQQEQQGIPPQQGQHPTQQGQEQQGLGQPPQQPAQGQQQEQQGFPPMQGQQQGQGQPSPQGQPNQGPGQPPYLGPQQLPQNQTEQGQGQFVQGQPPPSPGGGQPQGRARLLQIGNRQLGLLPTVDRLFAKIQFALWSMQGQDNTTEIVSRIHVTYNDTFGYPQRILIVYDVPSNSTGTRNYNEFTYFAIITNLESLKGSESLKTGLDTPAPSIDDATIITTQSELEMSLEALVQARSLWDSHELLDYQFDYDLFFDNKATGANRRSTPYPWRIVVEDMSVQTVTDAKRNLLFSTNSSTNIGSLGEESAEPTTITDSSTPSNSPPTANLTSANDATTVAPGQQDIESEETEIENTYWYSTLANNTQPPLESEGENNEEPQVNGSQSASPPLAVTPPSNIAANAGAKPGGMGPTDSILKGQDGAKLVNYILEASFEGASGPVSFREEHRKLRDLNGVPVGAFNIRPSPMNESTGRRTYVSKLTSYVMLTNSTTPDQWESLPNEFFIYRDGSTFAPTVLRDSNNQNYLSQWVHVVGLTLFAIALCLAVFSGIGVWYLRYDEAVRAGQPPFLYLLCLGSALMSAAIFTLSWDESYGWSDRQLDIACTLTPWFFFAGQLLIFTSLFSKLWRIDKVLQFSRQKVGALSVMGPLALLLSCAVIILSVWTAIDPWVWERILIQEHPAETYGECTSDRYGLWFLLLASLIVLGKAMTLAMAWKTADIPQDFSDTSSVFYAISIHLQAWFIGIPILIVLGTDSTDATYFGRVLLVWIFSVSGVALVVVPKIAKAIHLRRHPELRRKRNVVISGLSQEANWSRASTSRVEDPSPVNASEMGNSRRRRF